MRHTQLRSFHQVAVNGSVTEAARQLRVSQPTVTAQVKALERSYGIELFVRRHRAVELTPAGRQLLETTQRIFDLEREAEGFLRDNRELRRGHLRVGAVAPSYVTLILAAFNRRYPGISIDVNMANSQAAVQGLLDFRSDVAVLPYNGDDPRLFVQRFSKDAIGILMREDHPLADRPRGLRLADLEGQAMVLREPGSNTRRLVENALRRAGVTPRIVMQAGSREVMRTLVAAGVGVGAISTSEFHPGDGLAHVPIVGTQLHSDWHLLCLADRRRTRLVTAFLDVAAELKLQRGHQPSSRSSKG